jgi:capsular polysaccharide biosynthesis protein
VTTTGNSTGESVEAEVQDRSRPERGQPVSAGSVRARPRRRSRLLLYTLLPLLLAVVLGTGAGIWNTTRAPSYSAEALVSVLPTDPTVTVSTAFTSAWVQIAASGTVLDAAAGRLDTDAPTLSGSLDIAEAGDSPLVSIKVTTDDPVRSAAWANGVAAQVLAQGRLSPVPGYSLAQVTTAVAPAREAGLSTPLLVTAGALLGLLLGLAADRALIGRRRRRGTAAR